jgi:sporulation protein YlmC with PRC-barrel domain
MMPIMRADITAAQDRRLDMTETIHFTIGAEASCTDGVCGDVTRVVVDPVARAVTHLVVEPKHGQGLGRLIPLDLVDAATDEIRIRCTLAEFEHLDRAEETHFLSGSSGFATYGPDETVSWPYFGLGAGMGMGMAMSTAGGIGFGMGNLTQHVTYDSVPLGEVTVRRGEHVHATDGDIGRVQGLVINPDRHVTHVLLQEGHLWGRKEVAIPITAVIGVDDGVRLNITKQEVKDLPPVDVDHSNEE